MRGVKLHGALLAVALVWSFLLWTRDTTPFQLRERVVIWDRDTTAVQSVAYRSSARDVDIGWRDGDQGRYLWGFEVSRTRIFPPATTAGDSTAATADTLRVDTLAFPIGMTGVDVVRNLATFRVVRDLGMIPEPELERFGIGDPYANLTVTFTDGARELVVGNQPPGGTDRYALDRASGSLYVMPADVFGPLDTGAGALRERRLHYFLPAEVAQVELEVAGRTRSMVRTQGSPGTPATWSPPGSDQADQTFANFLERVAQLAIEDFEYGATVDPSERLLRIEYFDEDAEQLGFVELFRRTAGDGDRYYLVTERTRVPALGIRSLAERVATDLSQLF